MATAQYVEHFDQLFDCFNRTALQSKQVIGHAISIISEHTRFLSETQSWLDTVKADNKSGSVPVPLSTH